MASPYSTAKTILNRAAVQLGLAQQDDPYSAAGSDPNFASLCEFLNVACEELVAAYQWRHLRKTATITTVAGTTLYPLPADFHEMVDQTGWNRSTFLPLGGPLTSQQWQLIAARGIGVPINVMFRLSAPMEMEFLGAVQTGQTITFEYASTSCVQSAANSAVKDAAGAPTGDKPTPDAAADLVLFDPLLVVRAVKLQWLQAKGFDTTVAVREYQDRLNSEKGHSEGAQKLNLSRRAPTGDRLLDGFFNAPITGYGSR